MYYIMITTAAFLFSMQFMFNNGYEKRNGSSLNSALKFSLYSSVAGFILLLMINKFHLQISAFSFITALVYSLVGIALSYSSVKAFEHANLSIYSIFSMIGGMVLPFIYGILSGEDFKIIKLICCVFIAASILISIDIKTKYKKAIKYYIFVFLLNGMVGIISKFHQSYTGISVDSTSFIILTKIITILLSIVLIIILKEKNLKITKKSFVYCTGYSVFNSIGNLMLLIALLHLPASVQYPIVTGGVIVFSLIIDIIQKVRVTKREIISAMVAFIATILMIL